MTDKTNPTEVIGLDVGHSAVKVAAGEQRIMFPTAAAPAVALSMTESAESAKADLARVNGTEYWVGQTALIHTNGALLDGLRDDWIETQEHLALLASGYQRGMAATGCAEPHLVLGLPSRLHGRQHARLADLAAMHLQIERAKISVVPQPLGAFMAAMLDADGSPSAGHHPADERWGVIDVGYYTADYGLIDAGLWSAAGAESTAGANSMADEMRHRIFAAYGVQLPLRDGDATLRTRSAKVFGKVVDLAKDVDAVAEKYAQTLIESATRIFGARIATLDGIIVAGGAAELVHPHIQKVWPHAITAPQPRFTVAEGMRRYGLMKLIA